MLSTQTAAEAAAQVRVDTPAGRVSIDNNAAERALRRITCPLIAGRWDSAGAYAVSTVATPGAAFFLVPADLALGVD